MKSKSGKQWIFEDKKADQQKPIRPMAAKQYSTMWKLGRRWVMSPNKERINTGTTSRATLLKNAELKTATVHSQGWERKVTGSAPMISVLLTRDVA